MASDTLGTAESFDIQPESMSIPFYSCGPEAPWEARSADAERFSKIPHFLVLAES